jgi:hypothetical protein
MTTSASAPPTFSAVIGILPKNFSGPIRPRGSTFDHFHFPLEDITGTRSLVGMLRRFEAHGEFDMPDLYIHILIVEFDYFLKEDLLLHFTLCPGGSSLAYAKYSGKSNEQKHLVELHYTPPWLIVWLWKF